MWMAGRSQRRRATNLAYTGRYSIQFYFFLLLSLLAPSGTEISLLPHSVMLTSFFIVGSSLPFSSFLWCFERCVCVFTRPHWSYGCAIYLWIEKYCERWRSRVMVCGAMTSRRRHDGLDEVGRDHIEANKTNTRAFGRANRNRTEAWQRAWKEMKMRISTAGFSSY